MTDAPETKVCKRCGDEKALDEFAVDRKRPGGRYYMCKLCGCTGYIAANAVAPRCSLHHAAVAVNS